MVWSEKKLQFFEIPLSFFKLPFATVKLSRNLAIKSGLLIVRETGCTDGT